MDSYLRTHSALSAARRRRWSWSPGYRKTNAIDLVTEADQESDVLDLCYVTFGRVGALWEFGPRPWDVAAGALTITEAGGQVTNLDGSALDLDARKNLASNGKLHRATRETIAKAWPEADRREAESRAVP